MASCLPYIMKRVSLLKCVMKFVVCYNLNLLHSIHAVSKFLLLSTHFTVVFYFSVFYFDLACVICVSMCFFFSNVATVCLCQENNCQCPSVNYSVTENSPIKREIVISGFNCEPEALVCNPISGELDSPSSHHPSYTLANCTLTSQGKSLNMKPFMLSRDIRNLGN